MPLITSLNSEVLNNFNLDIHPNELTVTTSIKLENSPKQLSNVKKKKKKIFLSIVISIGNPNDIKINDIVHTKAFFQARILLDGNFVVTGLDNFLDNYFVIESLTDGDSIAKSILNYFLEQYSQEKEYVLK
jgi:hypothetical protein